MKVNSDFLWWPIAPFGGEDDEGSSEANDGVSQSNSTPDANKGKGSSASSDDDDDDEFKGLSAEELKRIAKDNAQKAKDAELEAKTFKDKQAAEERKKNDDLTNAIKDLEEERATTSALRATVTKQAIIGAIRDDSRFEWHDPEMVAQQLDPSVVKVDDDGKVEGIKASLPKIAKAHSFLLKKDNTGTIENAPQQNSNNGPTGFQPGQGGTSGGGGSDIDTKKLAENYPAITARV